MEGIFRSVVGKLWMTIIALFAVVLTIFSILLVQSFDNYNYNQLSIRLQGLAESFSDNFQNTPDKKALLSLASTLTSVQGTGLLLVDKDLHVEKYDGKSTSLPQEQIEQLLHNPILHLEDALAGKHPSPERIIFSEDSKENYFHTQILAVAVPVKINNTQNGAVVMYQKIEVLNDTAEEIRKLIYVVGVIAFTMTTVFAFFLSSRITSPLRQMKQTADRFAEGDFHAEIPIRSNDEIGDLALTFNSMASRLNEVVHALSQEKEQVASVLRSMVDGVIMIDAEGKIVLTNPPADHFLFDWEYEKKDTPNPIYELYKRLVVSELEIHEDIPVQGRNWSVVMAPLYDKEQVRGAVAVLRDLTKERKMDKLRKDFVANVSHELRTPLSMLQGYSEAIVDDIASSPEEHKELAKIIYDESVRMTKLVNELLDLARMEAGHVELHAETVELRPYLERIHRKFSSLARERDIGLQLEYLTMREYVDFDPDRIEQVLTNLIDNALRHTPASGLVTIRVKGKEELLEVEVSDTGSGIPQEDLPFIFERFYKADKARTRGRAGTGLGLAIARNIVEAHAGIISVQSRESDGTTFTMKLPI